MDVPDYRYSFDDMTGIVTGKTGGCGGRVTGGCCRAGVVTLLVLGFPKPMGAALSLE